MVISIHHRGLLRGGWAGLVAAMDMGYGNVERRLETEGILRSLGRWSSHGDTEHNNHDPAMQAMFYDTRRKVLVGTLYNIVNHRLRVCHRGSGHQCISLVSMCPAVETINHLAPVWALGTLGSSGSAIIGSRRHC